MFLRSVPRTELASAMSVAGLGACLQACRPWAQLCLTELPLLQVSGTGNTDRARRLMKLYLIFFLKNSAFIGLPFSNRCTTEQAFIKCAHYFFCLSVEGSNLNRNKECFYQGTAGWLRRAGPWVRSLGLCAGRCWLTSILPEAARRSVVEVPCPSVRRAPCVKC